MKYNKISAWKIESTISGVDKRLHAGSKLSPANHQGQESKEKAQPYSLGAGRVLIHCASLYAHGDRCKAIELLL